MKRIKEKISFILVLLLSVLVGLPSVSATGSATFKFTGQNTCTVGQTITVNLSIANISGVQGGVAGYQGNLKIGDTSIIGLNKTTGLGNSSSTMPLKKVNPDNNNRFNAMTDGDSYMTSDEVIANIPIDCKANGSTTIQVINGGISDKLGAPATVSAPAFTITVGNATPKSSDARLKSLVPDKGTLSPTFDKDNFTYSLPDQPNSVDKITFTASTNDTKATVTSGTTCNLTAGTTTPCKIVVKAEDGTTKTYTVNVKREAAATQPTQPSSENPNPSPGTQSNDASLLELGVSGYTLSPSFNASTLDYTVEVPDTATKVIITAKKSDSKATVEGTGDFTLTGDESTKTVKVTAEDGTVKEYKITVKKVATVVKDSDNKLKSLEVAGKTLSPAFSPDKTSYTLTVGSDVNKLDITALPNSEKAQVSISGATGLKTGKNTVTVKVKAENGSEKIYTITVTKEGSDNKTTTTSAKSSDTSVTNIIIRSPHKIEPAFNKDANDYNVTVPYDVEKLDLDVLLGSSKASYKIVGNESLLVGEVKPVYVVITAEDGTQRTIVLNVTRSTEEDGTKAKEIKIGGGVDIEFNPDVQDYTIDVGPGFKKLDFTKISVPEGSTYKIIGNENLKEGKNTVIVSVTDKDGYTRNYTFTVRKAAKTILGMKPFVFWIVLGIILLLLALLLLLLLLRRKKEEKEEEKTQPIQPVPPTPVIDFKPEFNFGSRNGTDDDTVYTGGSLNQDSSIGNKTENENKLPHEEPKYIDTTKEDAKEIPYDPYDEIVTKDELIDAIHEGLASKNPEKLKMLLEQEELNRKKEALRKKEEEDR